MTAHGACPRGNAVFALILFLAPAYCAFAGSGGGEIRIDDFSAGRSARWEKKVFRGETEYRAVRDEGRPALKAESRGTASALIYPIAFDPKRFPRLSWSWKVEGTIPGGDARRKSGDDYAARVYVVFPSALFWRTRALNYIWANRLPRGTFLPNAYTGQAVMVAVESGNAGTGTWVAEERNLVEDFRRAFGEDPPEAGAVAIMTDTDDTGGTATAWYGPIRLLAGEREGESPPGM